MTIEEAVIQKLRELPAEKKKDVLAYVESLSAPKATPRRSLLGLWHDLGVCVTAEDIAEARRQMWSDFPKDIRL